MTADLDEVLDHLSTLVEEARALPMSASCVVNRGEVLDLVDEARRVAPVELEDAQRVLTERDTILGQARAEAERLTEQAQADAEQLVEQARDASARLVEQTAVYTRAQAEADRLLDQAQTEADRLLDQAHAEAEGMRVQTEDYVEAKLASFENVLSSTLATVQRGRDRLSGRVEVDEPQDEDTRRVAAGAPRRP